MDAERIRLAENRRGERRWDLFGPYLSERAWGTVREDYSPSGDAWRYFPHDHARSRVYRWNEDGLAGISDDKQRLCLALAVWNRRDPILKERLFGLGGPEGNHGEDVKEHYFYLDSTPTHSYMRMLYKYPQAEFPYARLVQENQRRGHLQPEFELEHTGVFDEDRYFDIVVEYAKAGPEDILMRITATNRGPEPAPLHLLPTLWFRNTWSWGRDTRRPWLAAMEHDLGRNAGNEPVWPESPESPESLESGDRQRTARPDEIAAGHSAEPGNYRRVARQITASHPLLGDYVLACEDAAELLFTDNETNLQRLFGVPNRSPYVKDAFHEYLVHGRRDAVSPAHRGTKAAAHAWRVLAPGETWVMRVRLMHTAGETVDTHGEPPAAIEPPAKPEPTCIVANAFREFDATLARRQAEADDFYRELQPETLSPDEARVQRQALAGMLWSKQFYHYIVRDWLDGDPGQPAPPPQRRQGRNSDWKHLYNERVMTMPDKWEYPWYAAWDLAFHCIPLTLVDPDFAKSQLDLLTREWYQHPNGAIPAYEWNFSDVNPPVYAWATWRVYKMEKQRQGRGDRAFLETLFHKLLIHFTWWVNRKDSDGKNIFQGGFLGLDNIGVFDRSAPYLPGGGRLEQSDATSWMGMFCLNMMQIALELASENLAYENIASKFFEHFLDIADAMNDLGGSGIGLWDEEDQFFYDLLHLPDDRAVRLKIRSLVGLIPLLAVETLEPQLLAKVPGFRARLEWYLTYRPDLARLISRWYEPGAGERRLVALVRGSRMKRLLARMLDPREFLSDYGVRSLSKHHAEHPFELRIDGTVLRVGYEPAESQSSLFGGNSNWRGPVWFPINYLLIEALHEFHQYYSDDFRVECPTGSGQYLSLAEIADELSQRLMRLFVRDHQGRRAFAGGDARFQHDPHWRDHVLFHEYFHGDTGQGIGASHQTGWTGLIAKILQQQGERRAGVCAVRFEPGAPAGQRYGTR